MIQRSFRLDSDTLEGLNKIAEHLAQGTHKSPNQTTALAWAISRGLDAVENVQSKAKEIPEGLHQQILKAGSMMQDLAKQWESAVYHAAQGARWKGDKMAAEKAELEQLRRRVPELEAEIEKFKARPYRTSLNMPAGTEPGPT